MARRSRTRLPLGPALLRAVPAVVLCVVLVLALTVLNALTAGPIQQGRTQRELARLQTVMPGADSFSETWFDHSKADSVLAAFSDLELVGYCVTVTTQGFGGPMQLLVGVDAGGSVTGVILLSHRETGEMGALAGEQEFLGQFIGKSGTVRVERGTNAIEAISGATTTSRSVTEGVNAALAVVTEIQSGEVQVGEEGTV